MPSQTDNMCTKTYVSKHKTVKDLNLDNPLNSQCSCPQGQAGSKKLLFTMHIGIKTFDLERVIEELGLRRSGGGGGVGG